MDDDFNWAKAALGVFIAGLVLGAIVLAWVTILGPQFNRADYNNWNSSPQHIQAVSQKFTDDCTVLAQTKDAQSRKAIENDIVSTASTVDLKEVQMPDWTRACVNRAIQDINNP